MPAPAKPLGPTEVIAPAFERAKAQLFAPFRWGFWWRMAIVAFFAGEIGGGGFNINIPSGGFPQRTGRGDHLLMLLQGENPLFNPRFLPWIVALLAAIVFLFFVFLYFHSVFRFILFDSVIAGRCSIRQTWGNRSSVGTRFFVWLIFYQLILLSALAGLVAFPLYSWWRAGVFQHPDQHLGLLLGQGLVLFLAVAVLLIAAAVISLVARDFLLPQMALENLSIGEAWNRFRPQLLAEKGSMAGYILLKVVLNIAVSIALGIVAFIWILVLIVPAIIVGAILVASSAGTHGPALVAVAVVLGCVGFALLVLWFFVFMLLWVPAAVFFQSYALYYFGSRYPALAALLWLDSPSAPPLTQSGPDLPPIPTPA